MAVTIRDVALAASMHISAVSRVISTAHKVRSGPAPSAGRPQPVTTEIPNPRAEEPLCPRLPR